MVQVIKQPATQVVTKEGEIKILLEITLNINTNGITQITPVVETVEQVEKTEPEKDHWAIPSFKTDKIKFGKKVED